MSQETRTRREFIQLAGASVGAVAFVGCQAPKQELVAQSRVRLAEDLVDGHDTWYATSCRGCAAGCGAIIRVAAGRAKKMEGNPDHPVNWGRSCARGQAIVQEEYHPDRLQGPLLRTGPRGAKAFVPISWDNAFTRLTERLGLIRDQGRTGQVALLTRTHGALRAQLLQRFAGAYGADWLRLDPLPQTPIREATTRVFATERLPELDIQNARFLLSFGADFLSTWLSPVHYAYGYGIFRQGDYRVDRFEPRAGRASRGYMVHVEPRFSATAANADEWIWIRPGGEGLLALSIAQVILSEGLADPAGAQAFGDPRGLDGYAPEQVADETGVAADRIRGLARRFATEQPGLAFAGSAAAAQTNGTDNVAAVLALNLLVGNVGRPGGLIPNPPPMLDSLPPTARPSSLAEWQELVRRLRAGELQAVLVHEADPVYGLPSTLAFADALQQAPFIVSFSSFLDDTTALADLIMPSHLPLEDWGLDVPDPSPAQRVVTVQQPVVRPFYDTRSFWDLLLLTADRLGGPLREALPWGSFKEAIRATARDLARQVLPAAGPDVEFERLWTLLLQRGGWWESGWVLGVGGRVLGARDQESQPHLSLTPNTQYPIPNYWQPPQFAGDAAEFPFHLIVFPHHTLGDGQAAHVPWLQATPDPVTTVVWQSWVELNPRVAEQYGLREGDVVAVETPIGRVELPVYVSPAAPPDVLGIPMGWGHTSYGRWAEQRGINPMAILAPLVDQATGALAYGATRARLARTGRSTPLPKLEGTVPARQLEGEPVLKITRESV